MSIVKLLSKTDVWPGKNSKKLIIVHHTGSSNNTTFQGIINFFNKKDEISIHYVVGREGQITQLADENDRCFHAGKSEWNGLKDINNHSIGIEVLSDGVTFTKPQIDATVWLIKDIMKRNGISASNVLRHADIAIPRGRKTDIGPNFYKQWGDWATFQKSLSDLETAYADKAKELNKVLDELNQIKKDLAAQKGVKFLPLKII